MTLLELKTNIKKYIYMEDDGVVDVVIASIVTNRLSLGSKVWLAIVGESSGGKSQIINPVTQSDKEYFIKVDDITENTFLSGMGKGGNSLLDSSKVNNTISMTDLTVLFSRGSESRNAILSQFRMIFDGHMVKRVGTSDKPLEWKGRMGMLAGCTPTIYRFFEEVADMGERFIYYRLPENDPRKATKLALERRITDTSLNDTLSELYSDYIRDVVRGAGAVVIDQDIEDHIIDLALLAERIRTPVHVDKYTGKITNIPISAMPMRTALQLKSVALGLQAINNYEGSKVIDIKKHLDWLAFSLADEESRILLTKLVEIPWGDLVTAQNLASKIGLDTFVTSRILQRLTAIKIVQRFGSDDDEGVSDLSYRIIDQEYYNVLVRIVSPQQELHFKYD
jgi:predicted transcriptional regulator